MRAAPTSREPGGVLLPRPTCTAVSVWNLAKQYSLLREPYRSSIVKHSAFEQIIFSLYSLHFCMPATGYKKITFTSAAYMDSSNKTNCEEKLNNIFKAF
jgi:hypothetical protein